MSEVFREKVATPEIESTPIEVTEAQNKEDTGKPIQPDDKPLTDASDASQDNLNIWEGENKKKYVHDYFGVHNLAHEFNVKMPTGEIDKYIKEQIDEKGYDNTRKNYKSILAEIEQEIGSDKLELFKRFNKLTGYIRAMRKLYKAKKLKEKYLNTDNSA